MVAIRYWSPIDMHVHLRGLEYPSHEFALWAFQDAKAVGLRAVIEQPNPDPQLISLGLIKARRALIEKIRKEAGAEKISYKAYIGMTNDEQQVREALKAAMDFPELIGGDKTFYVHSTGNMGILKHWIQLRNWSIRGELNYDRPSMAHMEDEDEYDEKKPFDSKNPITHSLHQSEKGEQIQSERQIRYAVDSKYKGVMVFHHVSSPDTIDFLNAERKKLPFQIIIETTPHHMFLNTDDYIIHGNRVKMNPPLRTPASQRGVLERVIDGKTDVIATDHAPHPIEKKDSDNPPSGIPVIPIWPFLIGKLQQLGMSSEQIEKTTWRTQNTLFFDKKIDILGMEIEYDPSLWDKYGYNPFSRIDGTMGFN